MSNICRSHFSLVLHIKMKILVWLQQNTAFDMYQHYLLYSLSPDFLFYTTASWKACQQLRNKRFCNGALLKLIRWKFSSSSVILIHEVVRIFSFTALIVNFLNFWKCQYTTIEEETKTHWCFQSAYHGQSHKDYSCLAQNGELKPSESAGKFTSEQDVPIQHLPPKGVQ